MDYHRETGFSGGNVVQVLSGSSGSGTGGNWGRGSVDQAVWATEDDYRAWNREASVETNSTSNYDGRQSQSFSGGEPPNKKSRSSQMEDLTASNRSKAIGKMFYKTKLCCKFRAGTCPYVTNCNFAHSIEELRKPPPNWQEIVAAHEEERAVSLEPREEFQIPSLVGSVESQRSYKGRHCKKFYTEEGCPYGDNCTFLHDEQSKARESEAISLGPGMGGGYAGTPTASNLKPSNWKTRICNKWELTGYCPFGSKCHFAHGTEALNVASSKKYNDLNGGLEEDFKYISDELGQMKALLRVADRQEECDSQLEEWLKQVREAAYDAGEVLDEFMLRFATHLEDGYGFFAHVQKIYASIKNLRPLRRIIQQMRNIKSRVQLISERHQRYLQKYGTGKQVSCSFEDMKDQEYDGRGDALLQEEEEDLVGIQKPKEDLLNLILADDCGFRVHAVAGMGGLDKTTLVKKVYDDSTVHKHFNHHVWLNVSKSCRVQDLLKETITQLHKEIKKPAPKELEGMTIDTMKQFIRSFLQERRRIVVLDDIWQLGAWEANKLAFPRQNHENRILITTRYDYVARAATTDTGGQVYHMQLMSENHSWPLFCRNAFPGSSCPPYLEEIAKKILKRCNGLPLAIVVTGGLLATKSDRIEEWEAFYRSFGAQLHTNDQLGRMRKLLS